MGKMFFKSWIMKCFVKLRGMLFFDFFELCYVHHLILYMNSDTFPLIAVFIFINTFVSYSGLLACNVRKHVSSNNIKWLVIENRHDEKCRKLHLQQ